MNPHLLPWWKKYWLKYTDKKEYKWYKEQKNHAKDELFFIERTKLVQHADVSRPTSDFVSFKHSGHAGDIIYAMPAMLALAGLGKIKLYLHVNQPIKLYEYHPSGNVGLTEGIVKMLRPLLLSQPKIETVELYDGQAVDFDLDQFRRQSFFTDRNSIPRWYFHMYGVSYNTALPWLHVPTNAIFHDSIVIARSHRYRTPLIDYSFLKRYAKKLFIGVPEEYNDMKRVIPDLEFKPVNDFLELATIIKSCKLFIGNQSFPFSLAEALKAKRLLEVYFKFPNVIVEGEGANDFIYQPQFEFAVERLLNERKKD